MNALKLAELVSNLIAMGTPADAIKLVMDTFREAEAAEEARKAGQRERTAKSRSKAKPADDPDTSQGGDGNGDSNTTSHVTVTLPSRDGNGAEPSQVSPNDINSNPLPPHLSDPNGSAPAIAVAGDDREWLFDDGLKQLIAWGRAEKAGRSLIGKWLKNTKDDADLVRRAIEAAAERRVVVPVEWIEQGLKARMAEREKTNGSGNHQNRAHPDRDPNIPRAAYALAAMGRGASFFHRPQEEAGRVHPDDGRPHYRGNPVTIDAQPLPAPDDRAPDWGIEEARRPWPGRGN